jgi:hypothetical protein
MRGGAAPLAPLASRIGAAQLRRTLFEVEGRTRLRMSGAEGRPDVMGAHSQADAIDPKRAYAQTAFLRGHKLTRLQRAWNTLIAQRDQLHLGHLSRRGQPSKSGFA